MLLRDDMAWHVTPVIPKEYFNPVEGPAVRR